MMQGANTALRKNDDNAMKALGFSKEHIAELKHVEKTMLTIDLKMSWPDYCQFCSSATPTGRSRGDRWPSRADKEDCRSC